MRFTGNRFRMADSFQQMIGGMLLAGPFVVESGSWDLAASMHPYQAAMLIALVLAIGWAALYKADKDRVPEKEVAFLRIPVRYISLISVSYVAVIFLLVALSAPSTFGATLTVSFNVVAISAVFSVIGVATADSVF